MTRTAICLPAARGNRLEDDEGGGCRSVPPTAGEPTEGNQPDEGDDEPGPEAPDEHQDDAHDDDDPAQRDPASGPVTSLRSSHPRLLDRIRCFVVTRNPPLSTWLYGPRLQPCYADREGLTLKRPAHALRRDRGALGRKTSGHTPGGHIAGRHLSPGRIRDRDHVLDAGLLEQVGGAVGVASN